MRTGGPEASGYARDIRRHVLEQSKRANVGHIGSSLSVAEILAALFTGPLGVRSTDDGPPARFVLAKGHAALGLYAALHLNGVLDRDALNGFGSDGSLTGVHPDHRLPGIEFSTGSLGQGLSFAAGAALAARITDRPQQVYVLMSDAECNEGSVWEAAMFAGHHRLADLTAIVDLNGQQALGYVKDVQDPGPMAHRWRAARWDVVEVDGHDVNALSLAFLKRRTEMPRVVIARTTFGKGVSFMERRIEWHYLPMSDDHYALAMREVLG